ncbi:alcohol dehydrogenase catalytic domain-containing protein [Pseudomonas cremoricolorata]|uniref:Alcohol dehydrogenase-like N-terminal domain-containing protein n=1 Tax=Pseudomonas cremoricolorata TaxID=157783 RepID=A0A089WNL0_9PSED|nr:hypothetical protein LK03_17260 [Pseudomonas cremoricolorata]
MRALTYHGATDVRVDTVPDPILEAPDDIILRVTATAICGSDLHLYHGKIPQTESGDIFGHEFMGVVEEVGSEVSAVSGVYAGFIHGFLFGDAFDKGLTFKMGQTHVQRFLPERLEHIEAGRLQPELIITHRLALEEAPLGYQLFDKKQDDCRKVILVTGAAAGTLGADHEYA